MSAPPPPPPPPILGPALAASQESPKARSALLESIRQGKKLKKTTSNDKSAPKIGNTTSSNNRNGSSQPAGRQNKTNGAPPPFVSSNGINMGNIINGLQNLRPTGNRGPPPPAPVRFMADDRPQINGDIQKQPLPSTPAMQQSSLHRKTNSNSNFDVSDNARSVVNHGKPNLAPKPPPINGKPAAPIKAFNLNGKPLVSRAHSMRTTRSPSPKTPDAIKFGTVRNMASLLAPSVNASMTNLSSPRQRTALNNRPSIPPPDIPSPAPPPAKISVKPPNHAPPPPPTHAAPPPPPHRAPAPTRAPPAVPQVGLAAPPPPPRHSSMTPRGQLDLNFEERFSRMFRNSTTFPRPPPYKNLPKNDKKPGGKQQAPQPPKFQSGSNNNRQWNVTSAC